MTASTAVLAGDRPYTFEIPDRVEAVYVVEFEVAHPGPVGVLAQWPGGRVLSFRLEAAGQSPLRLLRSGPSPQKLIGTATGLNSGVGTRPWRLTIRALPGRGASQVALTVELPDGAPPRAAAKPKPTVEPEIVDVPAWAAPAASKDGGSPRLAGLYQAVERFRSAIVGRDGQFALDPCSWHSDLLQRVVAIRDGLTAGRTGAVEGGDAACLARLSAAVRSVEQLRASADPLLAGPVPTDASERVIWRAKRGDFLRPLESTLDALLEENRKGSCWSQGDAWPARFSACLIACERYFEERVRIGDEAPNAELAKAEWSRYMEAADIFDAIVAAYGSTPPRDVP